ncbi:hypothetical protein EI546_11775 [Aequorivita sp. H23M31]|uniref:Uncharacterized protein n=1 Tax=Aequorivita ciconiae TaxID=2494375 RepID=A0A410G512_9FLAO|nr:hypothetical protein EI546_11775 [Aequorivita sp. H23M31]
MVRAALRAQELNDQKLEHLRNEIQKGLIAE